MIEANTDKQYADVEALGRRAAEFLNTEYAGDLLARLHDKIQGYYKDAETATTSEQKAFLTERAAAVREVIMLIETDASVVTSGRFNEERKEEATQAAMQDLLP